MIRFSLLTAAALAVVTLAGCTGTGTTITEYDSEGRVVKITTTTESVVATVVESTKDKTVAVYDNSFLAYVSASSATTDDPTPHVKFGIGQADRGMLTMPKECDQQYASKIVEAMRAGEISVSASGVSYGGKTAETASAAAK